MTVLLGAAPSIIGPSDVGAWMAAKGAPGAAAVLDFAGQKYGFRSLPGVPRWGSVAADMVFARASAAGRWPSAGAYEMVGSGVLRYEHDPATRDPLGALIEGARTNLLIGSDGRRGFSPLGTSPPTTAITTHLGKACAAVTFPASSIEGWNVARAAYPYQTYPFPNTYSWSYKLATNRPLVPGEKFAVLLNGSFATAGLAFTSADNLSSWVSRSVAGIANNNLGANTNLYPAITYAVTLGDPLTVYITDMQMELGPGPSSYVPTGASAVTRAADQLYLGLPFDPASEGVTVLFDGITPPSFTPTAVAMTLIRAGSYDRLQLYATTGNFGPIGVNQNGTEWAPVPAWRLFVPGARRRVVMRLTPSSLAWSQNGDAVTTAALLGAIPADMTRLEVGTTIGGNHWRSTISRVAIWKGAPFNDAQMRELSAL